MIVAGEMWEKHLNNTFFINDNEHQEHHHLQPTIVFTTEATSMVDEQKAFENGNKRVSRYPKFTFNYMTNRHDVTPNSGFMADARRK
jgi:hypothetical protein